MQLACADPADTALNVAAFLEQYRIAFVEGNATGAMCSYNVSGLAPAFRPGPNSGRMLGKPHLLPRFRHDSDLTNG